MKSMYLSLGYACNQSCYFCPCGDKKGLAPVASKLALFKAIDEGIYNHNIEHITVSGGEPTLHPDFHQIIKYCVGNGVSVGILSNGQNLCDLEKCKNYFEDIDANYLSIIIPLHGDKEDTHQKVTTVENSFAYTLRGIKNVLSMNILTTIKHIISKWNYERLPNFVDFLYYEIGVNVSISLCGMDFCGMPLNKVDEVTADFSEMSPKLESALDRVMYWRKTEKAFPNVSVTDLPLCVVDPYYWRFFTASSRYGVNQYSAPEKETGQVVSKMDVVGDCGTFFSRCTECVMQHKCPGVWRSVYEYFGDKALQEFKSIK